MKIMALTYLLSLKPEVVSHERSMEISECLVQSVQSPTDWSTIQWRAEGCFFSFIHVKDELETHRAFQGGFVSGSGTTKEVDLGGSDHKAGASSSREEEEPGMLSWGWEESSVV